MKIRYVLNGKQVTEEEFAAYVAAKSAEGFPAIHAQDWDLHSNAASFHPKRRAEVEEFAGKSGVPTEVDELGRPIFRSLRHQRRFLRLMGWHNEDDIDGGHP